MKKSITIVFCMFFVIALLAVSCGSPKTEEAVVEPEAVTPENELIGVWKLTEVTLTGPEAQTITDPLPGIAILSEDYVSYTGIMTPRPELPEDATDAQVAAAFRSFDAFVSKYEINGNIITATAVVNLNPNVKEGDSSTMEYEIEGDDCIMTQKTDSTGPVENPYTLKFTRIE